MIHVEKSALAIRQTIIENTAKKLTRKSFGKPTLFGLPSLQTRGDIECPDGVF
jgi:hypothetical protein